MNEMKTSSNCRMTWNYNKNCLSFDSRAKWYSSNNKLSSIEKPIDRKTAECDSNGRSRDRILDRLHANQELTSKDLDSKAPNNKLFRRNKRIQSIDRINRKSIHQVRYNSDVTTVKSIEIDRNRKIRSHSKTKSFRYKAFF
jgi:hypothetical protein